MSTVGTQVSFADMGTPLERVTFVVVDLETTGGAPGGRALTEIGAVKVRGGQVLTDFSTLVNPGVAIPAQITMLTGITNAMVAGAPGVRACVEAFLTWAGLMADDVVLVAHNARFDVGHPYLELWSVVTKGVFYAATRLYGITFHEREDLAEHMYALTRHPRGDRP